MRTTPDDIYSGLQDAGCPKEQAVYVSQLLKDGQKDAAVRELNRCRCQLLDALHKTQRQVDCLDYLIRQTKEGRN
ncbi:MAG: hypothetical protein IKF60_09645 [Solobacterium sp.]|nr:hypothetical protein [Solobacterium sp.]MBR3203837.1 hypothetical protein [Solobacterium sp.]MBR3345621.1 hypothetical protein [Solobacterium sp.]